MQYISKKLLFFILLLSCVCKLTHAQVSSENNPFSGTLVDKSKQLLHGKIDYTEMKKIKGLNKPVITTYTLTFSKNLSNENQEFNIHLFNEQDFILYLVNETGSYTINFKDRQVVIDHPDKLLSVFVPMQAFFSFYGAELGKNLLLSGDYKEMVKEVSTNIYFTEEKIFTDYLNIQKKNKNNSNNILYKEEYEFRTKDSLLTKHISKIVNPNLYAKGTPTKTETILLSVALENDEDYDKSYHYDYRIYVEDDFQVIDRRIVIAEQKTDKTKKVKTNTIESNVNEGNAIIIAQLDEKQKIFQLQLDKLENELIPLFLQAENPKDSISDINQLANIAEIEKIEKSLPWGGTQQPFLNVNDSTLDDVTRLRIERQEILNAFYHLKVQIEEQLAIIKQEKDLLTEKPIDSPEQIANEEVDEIALDEAIVIEEIIIVEETLPKTTAKQQTQAPVRLLEKKPADQVLKSGNYYIVLGCFREHANAVRLINTKKKEYSNVMYLGVGVKSGLYMVGLGPYETREEANNLIKKGIAGWVLTK